MLPQPMSWSEPREDDSNPLAHPDLVEALERQVATGFPPGLALDLVLNELLVRAATATRARSAALALKRDDEMVCRAATGEHAPDLGIPLNTRDGLSGACLRTHQSQLCLDTETDPRVDAAASRRLGIRSMLIVPVMEEGEMVGVLEVFGTDPAEFVDSDQNLLEIFAREAARIRLASLELEQRAPALSTVPAVQLFVPESKHADPTPAEAKPADATLADPKPVYEKPADPKPRMPYDTWTVLLGGLAIFLAVGISFLIGSRVGWLGLSSPRTDGRPSPAPVSPALGPQTIPDKRPIASPPSAAKSASDPNQGGLVVYEQGRVVFRTHPAARRTSASSKAPSGETETTSGSVARVWLAPGLAEARLRQRSEPQYPADALAAHRAGDVILEVVVGADGSTVSTRVVSGDPLLATAASDAVRTWRYEPYRVQGRPAEFQTDVTLKFALPD
ncbi:MAG TPA: TonB family protein [Terriglobales bacterium]|nr:TonB family protein [Terriglobales bacterium]